MALTAQQIQAIARGYSRFISNEGIALPGTTKPDLIATLTAIDAWYDSTNTNFNNALPAAARNNWSATEKGFTSGIVRIAQARPEFLRRLMETN